MSIKPALCAAIVLLASSTAAAQQKPVQLPMPRDVKAAFAKGTRSPDGKPGSRYWQNRARYVIELTAAPPNRAVHGTEQITYFNNSPDTLRDLVFRLYLNIHKPGAPRDGGASENYLTSGVHVDAFTVNGQAAPWPADPGAFTTQRVKLPVALNPRDSVRLSVTWHYDASRESNREGMIDSTTLFLAYFYPRVAVYDDYNGWDRTTFTDQQEFYSDFNDYDVTVKVPANFVVWGTGTLVDPASVLQPAHLSRFQASLSSDTTIHVATHAEMLARSVTRQGAQNSWHFSANDIPDMAFATSDHYVWDASSVVVDDVTRRRASTQAAFNDTAADYHHLAGYARHALSWLSHNWPGVPYPYEKTTVVQGFAGMEYPMMVNDEAYADTTFSRFVAEHEIAHTYMPFYMGINEARYAFMDEGWATTFEFLIGTADLGAAKAVDFFRQFRVNGWISDSSPLQDLPIITPADALKDAAYGNSAYGKAALGYLALKDMIGDASFRKALHEYMDRWHGKHPLPWDFFNTFNNVNGKDLSWFFHDWYFTSSYIDLSLADVKKTGAGYMMTIINTGGMPAPVDVIIRYADGTTNIVHQTSAIWAKDQHRTTVSVPAKKTVTSIELNGGIWMDANTTDNSWSRK
ncbi:MAG: hypothetical protein JWM95_1973 [Gemmatimonadetes bacterium]|nr:hypothetical protein [Gemmatimonadota bacterium]